MRILGKGKLGRSSLSPPRRKCKRVPALEEAAERLYLSWDKDEEICGVSYVLLFLYVDGVSVDAVPLS